MTSVARVHRVPVPRTRGLPVWAPLLLATQLMCSCAETSDGLPDASDGDADGDADGTPGGTDSGAPGGAGAGGGEVPVASAGDDPTEARVCEEPTPWPLPTTQKTVGDGSSASCSSAALGAALVGGGHITFDCGPEPVEILVTAPLLAEGTTVLDGEGRVTLSGGGSSQILMVPSGAALSVRRLRFVEGRAPETMEAEGIGGAVAGMWRSAVEVIDCTFEENTASRGGGAVAVWTDSTLSVVGSRFTRNHSWYGGAIYSLLSPLSVINSDFIENTNVKDGGLGDGGAIGTDGASASPDDDTGGAVVICGSRFEGNVGYGQGGAAYVWVYPPDTVLIDRTTVAGNRVEPSEGGAAFGGGMRVSNGAITISASTFSDNSSVGNGGALYLDCAPSCDIVNTTFSANASETYGGAIFGDGATIENVTFAENFAGGHGGAIFGGGHRIDRSLFVNNESGNPWGQARNCSDTFLGEHVLQWRTETQDAGGDTCVPDPLVADPKLSALGHHGGTTETFLPGPSSAALDQGTDCPPVDQRGEPRPAEACDLGAVEVQP